MRAPAKPRPPLLRDPELGPLLFRANQEYGSELDEAAAFRRLQARLAERRQRASFPFKWAGAGALVVSAVAAVWLGVAFPSAPQASRVLLSAEPSRADATPSIGRTRSQLAVSSQPTTVPNSAPTPSADEARSASPSPGRRNAAPKENATEREAEASLVRRGAEPKSKAPESEMESLPVLREPGGEAREREAESSPARQGTEPSPAATESEAEPSSVPRGADRKSELSERAEGERAKDDCLALARAGSTNAAESCFRLQAEGEGLDAELALYELARLERDVRGNVRGALIPLEEALRRYPRGTLSDEMRLLRLELLVESRQAEQALIASEQLLASAVGRRRAAELYLLRGHVRRTLHREYRAAATEYEKAEAAGPLGARAAYYLGWCLERLAQYDQARAAYRRYLQADLSEHREQARKALRRLGTAGAAAPLRRLEESSEGDL